MAGLGGARISINGIVQGVGFRPFVFSMATQLGLKGWVRNTSAGVEIEIDGSPDNIQYFLQSLEKDAPPLSRIDNIKIEGRQANGFERFEIVQSTVIPGAFQPVSPDVSICEDCLRELFDPEDRRYLYPFINCTNCGPRFTIIQDIPYDRQKTTMASFKMCPECEAEYNDPLNRRFHAQPVACPACGPNVWLQIRGERFGPAHAIKKTIELLRDGKIIAIKGLGGFHLACDATNPVAVEVLRSRKLRVDKPFAVMMRNIEVVRNQCDVNMLEEELLSSKERPIVILNKKTGSTININVAPGQDTLGIMLPYTPLHYLLFNSETAPLDLVMTSGNLSEEPIATDNNEAFHKLIGIADAFLLHDRPIHIRCDDSVARVIRNQEQPVRRSRGYVPFPVNLEWEKPPILAVGGELKNVFCITRGKYAFMSHHIGDLENFETMASFEEGIRHFENLFRVNPQTLAYDLHPDYLATRYALERSRAENIPAIGIQHHHAHIAACMLDNQLSSDEKILGVALDGTGLGEDGAIWGGEFLLASYKGYQRLAHLKYVPLLGGETAIREPWRLALAWLHEAGIEWADDLPPVKQARRAIVHLGSSARSEISLLEIIRHQLTTRINSPLTSSAGRLFDAGASIIGIRQTINYEAQAAIELEAQADPDELACYSFDFGLDHASRAGGYDSYIVDPRPMIIEMVSDYRSKISQHKLAAKFHNTVARMVLDICLKLSDITGIRSIALSGGVWQNMMLFNKAVSDLEQDGFKVFFHHQVPCNDGGLALGQAAIASKFIDAS